MSFIVVILQLIDSSITNHNSTSIGSNPVSTFNNIYTNHTAKYII